jgi:threonine dehydratase
MVELSAIPVTIAEIFDARDRIGDHIHRTPLLSSKTLGRMSNTDLFLKAENLQKTGSYKVRGALNAVALLDADQRSRGVVTFSAGNHGQALAFAAARSGVQCTVFMAKSAVPEKVEAIRGYGAETKFGADINHAFELMETFIRDRGATYVSPFADPAVIAGQGTVALEILEELPETEQIVVGIGGGGLASGVAIAAKALRPEIRVVGVEPEGSTAVSQGLDAGKVVRIAKNESIADGLCAPFSSDLTLGIIREFVDDVVTVSDQEIAKALNLILARTKLLAEPAGAAGVAALLTGKAAVPHGATTVAVLSGGNVAFDRLAALI